MASTYTVPLAVQVLFRWTTASFASSEVALREGDLHPGAAGS